ncbi:GNAT family N-acetyltransferase [Massilia sp. CCM 8733]|uniref:GNAT family N-acetyltransferase n=1 Tax=Massilia mucilaginosa TaxID=2609282 RepID=A0ABX0NYM1_9BURK|nr:GNAT family N-acetyltransferase [Massilia mucilaginosa]NHZ92109.1 GNAT family N-acetyltransferase [Massilia mucilaginosa]
MTIILQLLSLADLRTLAASRVPRHLTGQAAPGALPPAFVAQRALELIEAGKSPAWCATFVMLRVSDQMVVGACGFKDEPRDGQVEIGYAVSPDWRGQGIATDAVAELARIAFAGGTVERVLAQIAPDNTASLRVAGKLGFEAGATLRDAEGDELVQWVLRKPA